MYQLRYSFFFFNDSPPTEIYTLSLHDALPIYRDVSMVFQSYALFPHMTVLENVAYGPTVRGASKDRKSTRLNSSHMSISYAVFCLKKKKKQSLHSGFFFQQLR